MERLKSDIRRGELRPVYMFYGDEEYLKNYYIGEMAALLGKRYGECGRTVIDGDGFMLDDFLDAVENTGFGAQARLVVLRNLDIPALGEGQRSQLEAALSELSEGVCVVLLYDDRYLERGDYKTRKGRKERMLASCKAAVKISFPLQSEAELSRWLCRRVRAAGSELSEDVARYMLTVCDSRMSALIGEAEKLGAFAAGRPVTRGDVEAVCLRSIDAGVFDIVRHVMEGRLDEALRRMDDMRKNGDSPILLTSVMGASFCELAAAKAGEMAGVKSAEKVVADFGIKPNKTAFVRDYIRRAARLSEEAVTRAVITLHEADLAQKSGGGDGWELLERAVMELAAL